ncbi:MAG: response regulator, partial [Dehalococcoidia bacterium]|nr:response regulator [Dehalococcoidia bacterium]
MQKHAVLVVDDEAIVRESIRDWLKDAGYRVATAESGEQALEMIENQDFSIMILDIRLPGKTGITVLGEVKAQRPWVKSIIITAYPSAETAVEAMKLGAVDYLIKPFTPDSLEKLVRDTLGTVVAEPRAFPEAAVPAKRPGPGTVAGKKLFVLDEDGLKALVEGLGRQMDVVGVRTRDGKYVYDRISRFDDLRLDYDVTVMPPTRYLRPEKETLLKFRLGAEPMSEPVVEAPPRAIIGVHPYDIRAIELLDEAFISTHPDPNYIARRQNTVIIGVDCLHPSPKSFASSMGTNLAETGFDLMLTDIGSEYLVTVGSKKGADLLAEYAEVREPTGDDIARQKAVRDKAVSRFRLSLAVPRERLPRLLEDCYDDPYWQTKSEKCLSCGSCVTTCPTCFCFDVQDEVALNLKDGERFRRWDDCTLQDFARVATGENFRQDRASRLRHRIYRKGKYVLERYGMV